MGVTFTRRFGGLNRATKKIKIERATGPSVWMASSGWGNATTNQKSAKTIGYIRGDGAQGNDHGGESCCSFSAINILGAKKE